MKVVILAGGLGTRLMEETVTRPKPMVEIGGRPILWHIMKYYGSYGHTEFVVCLGYRGYMIKEYFANYLIHNSDVTIDVQRSEIEIHHRAAEPWRVTLVDTGEATMTGGRLKRIAPFVEGERAFFLTYGDGLSDVDLDALAAFHERHGGAATLTAVQPPGRYGALDLDGTSVRRFREKPGDGGWINGGFFVLGPDVFSYIEGDGTHFEAEPLETLAAQGRLQAFEHRGFWQAMDTLRDRTQLERLWETGRAPWARWTTA